MYLLRHYRACIGGCLIRLSIAPWTHAIRFSFDVTELPYTILFMLIPQKIVERWQCWPRNWSHSINPLIWICDVEVILHISIEVRRWLKGCIPAVLGHQNELEQIVTTTRSQTTTLYRNETVRFWTEFHLEQWSVCRHAQHTMSCRCFWDTLYMPLFTLFYNTRTPTHSF